MMRGQAGGKPGSLDTPPAAWEGYYGKPSLRRSPGS
jgi:hypothetical protein